MDAPDIIELKEFYATPLGETVRQLMLARVRQLWRGVPPGEAVLAFGFPLPLLPEQAGANGALAVGMPACQGAVYWPPQSGNRVVLTHDGALPFADNRFNRVLILHGVEHSEQLRALLSEVRRVLTPGGRVLAVVPNRLGLWCHSTKSPFGHGRPFSAGQLRAHLLDSGLTCTQHATALFFPPSRARLLRRFARVIEKLGELIVPLFGGVLMVEAEKQIYAAVKEPVRARHRIGLVVAPAVQPAKTY